MTRAIRTLTALLASAPFVARAGNEPPPAGDVGDISELDLEVLLGTVTAASGVAETVATAPATVTVIDRRRIRLSGARNLPGILRRVPGVQVMENAPGSYIVSLRGTGGLQGNNLVVLLDGIMVNNPVDGTVNWDGLPVHVDQITRIEVVRGPVSTIHGANAFTGVINIVTSREPAGDARPIRGGAGAGVDGSALGSAFASAQGVTAGGFDYAAHASARYRSEPISGAAAVTSGLEHLAALFTGQQPLGEDVSLTFHGAASRARRTSLDYLALAREALAETDLLAGAKLTAGGSGGAFRGLELHGHVRRYSTPQPEGAISSFTYRGIDALRFAGGADLRFDFGPGQHLSVGTDAGVTRIDAWFLHPDENQRFRQDYGAYANGSIELYDALHLALGARLDVSSMTRTPNLSYRASAIWHENDVSLRISAGSAYRHPTQVEVGSRFVDPATGLIVLEGNPYLDAPEVMSVEAGAIVAVAPGLTLVPTIYLAQIGDLVVTDFEPLVRKTFSNDPVHRAILGGELEVDWRITPWLDASAQGTAIHFFDESDHGATVGVASQTARLTGWLELHASFLEDRAGAGLGAGYASERSYAVRAGVPPALLLADLPAQLRAELSADLRLLEDEPFWIWARLATHLPGGRAESPLPGARAPGTSAFVGIDVRGD